jgi:alpha-glucosidase
LGYHQARWTYTPDAEVLRIAQGFRERRIPCDAIHLDIDHMDGCRVFTWDPTAFADPARLCHALADRGFNTVVIVDAGIKQQPDGYPVYADGHGRGMFVRRSREPDAEEFTGHVWPGLCVFPDHTRDEVRKWWGQFTGRTSRRVSRDFSMT